MKPLEGLGWEDQSAVALLGLGDGPHFDGLVVRGGEQVLAVGGEGDGTGGGRVAPPEGALARDGRDPHGHRAVQTARRHQIAGRREAHVRHARLVPRKPAKGPSSVPMKQVKFSFLVKRPFFTNRKETNR